MRTRESGNVFFYIFVCIALLAALSFSVSQGSRSTVTNLTEDRQRLVATEIIAFGDIMGKTTSQLRLRGTTINQLSFASSGSSSFNDDPPNEVFNPAGGAVVYKNPPSEAQITSESYEFLANNEIENIGSTCGANTCADLIMIVPNIKKEVCLAINALLNINNPGGNPPVDDDIDEDNLYEPGANPFNFAGTETLGDDDTELSGKREACFAETDEDPDEYIYYKVLMAR